MNASKIVRDHMEKYGSITPEEFFKLYNLDSNSLHATISGIENKDNVRFRRVYAKKKNPHINNCYFKKVVRYEVVENNNKSERFW